MGSLPQNRPPPPPPPPTHPRTDPGAPLARRRNEACLTALPCARPEWRRADWPQVAAGSVQKAVIVETKKEFQRPDGSTLRFDRNACVLVNAKGMPIGSRVLGFVTHELRARNLMKVALITPSLTY